MKRFALLGFAVLLVAGLSAAQVLPRYMSRQYQLAVGTPATQPTTVSDGMPLVGPNKEAVKSLSVTVSDYNDGGADHDFIWLADVKAWVWKQSTKFPDGGAGWMRAPQYDFTVDAGTSAGVPIQASKTHGITTVLGSSTLMLPNTGGADRIYFQTSALLGNDGGAPVHTVLIEATY